VTPAVCLLDWRLNTPCGAYCKGQTQADRKNCQAFLDCYKNNNCGPTTCGGQDQVCGVNVVWPKMGKVPQDIADLVYECMACPGTTPTSSCNGKINTTPCADGNACTTNDKCQNNSCISGSLVTCTAFDQCHNSGTCNPVTGQCSNPAKPAGTVCRASTGPCDVAEICDGTDAGCPADQFVSASTVCRDSAGPCDLAETCTGASAACPTDAFLPSTSVCRAAAGACDVAETCRGASADCPADMFVSSSTVCRAAAGVCDLAETCTGSAAECPPDVLASASTVCRASTAACDPAETCTGSSPTCPTDVTTGTPPSPSGLAAMGGNGQVSLTWTASAGATSYNVKRSTTSGGPYGTVFTSTSPSYTDTGLTNGTAYYYVVTAVSNCGESANSSEVPGAPFTPIPPRALPKPPSEDGCYWYTSNGWEPIPCEPVSDAIQSVGRPVIPPSLASPYVEAPPNPKNSICPPLVPDPASAHTPFVFGQVDLLFPVVGTEQDVPVLPPPYAGCPSSGSTSSNAWSVQLNTNKFVMNNGDNAAVQFAIGSGALGGSTHICAWQVDATTQNYDDTSICVKVPPPTRSTGLHPFDFVSIAGSVDAAAGTLGIVVQLSWIEPGWPNIYSRVGTDSLGLAGNWLTLDGAVLGLGDCSQAEFTETSVVTRLMASSCPGVTSPTSNTSSCPPPTLQPNVSFENRTATAESNNLIQIGTPSVSYPNPYLAVTNTTATTSGACIDPKHIYVRDYDSDSGAVPSNAAGQAFWESPDIFVVPQDTPVDPNSTPAQSLITPDGYFDVWVRVHNDLGCAQVTGAKALVYIADPTALSTSWNPLTDNQYKAATPAGTTVEAGNPALIGPFTYHAPKTVSGNGHKCLIAAIIADGEPEVDNNHSDAPNSNQVAQRNVQFESCAFPLTNTTGFDGDVEIMLSVVPPETSPKLSTSGPNISVTFDDGDSRWHDVWMAQPENGTAYSVSSDGSKTTVRLGKAGVTLHAVPLHDGESRTARGNIAGLPSGAPLTTLGLQATLKNPSTGELLAQPNGGSCKVMGGIIIP